MALDGFEPHGRNNPSFVHLRVRTGFSLLDSMLSVKSVAGFAKDNAMPAIGLTETNNLFSALEASTYFADAGVQPIIGCSLNVAFGEGEAGELALLARSEAGYKNLMALSSKGYLAVRPEGVLLDFSEVLDHCDGLIALTGGATGWLNRLAISGRERDARRHLASLRQGFGDRLYVELQRLGLPQEHLAEEMSLDLAYDLGLPVVATNDCRFLRPSDHSAHEALMCIAKGAYVSQPDRPTASKQQFMRSANEMHMAFADLGEALDNTIEIVRRCHFRPRSHSPILPRFTSDAGRDEGEELRAQASAGLEQRLSSGQLFADRQTYLDRLDFELNVINTMGFDGYFLIVADFIKWAKQQGIPVGPGRGSGAGSLVAWSLTITDLDPLRFGLLFERFLNPERVSMPDFDIDFCQERRGEVINYVRDKYGEDKVAHIITFGTLQAKAVLRDVGRVMQMSYTQVDRLAKLIPFNPANPPKLADAIRDEPRLRAERDSNPDVRNLIETALKLEGLYRNASTHAAGVVIGDRPLVEIAPLYRDPRSDLPATQFNMKWAEEAGLVKFDFLGLKTLTVIDRALGFLKSQGREIGPSWETLDDPASYQLMASGDTLGVFQLESSGMRDTLRKVRPDTIEDVIALISLYRPGPMKNIDTFADVKSGKRPADLLHPALEPVLKETYGVIVYQEQVMQIAQILAGYSLGEADLLRRAMGKKKPEEMAAQKTRFTSGARARDVSEIQAAQIFELVNEFAGYGFNKSHAAAYAVIAYQTAYLRANFPVEFLAASMSLDLHNTDKLASFVQEAKRLGIEIIAPDVNRSTADFSVQEGAIVYALGALKGVGLAAMGHLEDVRRANGPFKDLYDVAERLDPKVVNKRCFEALSKAGAFDAIETNRARACASADRLAAHCSAANEARNSSQVSLFGASEAAMRPPLPSAPPWGPSERLDNEFSAIGFYLSGHPLDDLLKGEIKRRITLAHEIVEASRGRALFEMIGIVRARVEKTSRRGAKFAFVILSDPSGEYEASAMAETLEQSRDVLEPGTAVICRIRARRTDEELRLTIDDVKRLSDLSFGAPERMTVRISDQTPLETLFGVTSHLAKAPSDQRGALCLEMEMTDGRVAVVELAGRFDMTFKAEAALKGVPGVEAVLPY
jgi:DNA polymerase III subunit alpha